MEKLLYDERHFTDVLGGLCDGREELQPSDDTNKFKRRPKCKTRNKCVDESLARMCDDSCCEPALFALPNSTAVTRSVIDGCTASHCELTGVETAEFTNASIPSSESLPVFDILCSSLQCSESVTSHQAAALTRWLRSRWAIPSANSSLMQILMASKCPLVTLTCCRLLKQSPLTPSVTSCMFPLSAESTLADDIVSNVLFLQKEMVKFLETGQFNMSLLNVICLLDCTAATCRDVTARRNKLSLHSRCCSHWSSSELRWTALTVASLADVVSAKARMTSANSRSADANSKDVARCVKMLLEGVPQVAYHILSTSVHYEVAQASNVFRILNEYWHTTDFCQRQLLVEAVLVPKCRMELCILILAGYCDVLLQEYFAQCLSLEDLFGIFAENVIVSAITQRVWTDDSSSVVSHCREICLVLCNAVCSYILHQKGEPSLC